MAMPATIRRWTKELVQSLPNDGNRYELVAGELLVTPVPVERHQSIVVESYWVVDPDRHVVDVWRPGDEEATTLTDAATWRVTPDAPELTISLPEIFRPLR